MKTMNRCKVTCLECGESDILTFDNRMHIVADYEKKIKTPFLSFRWRPDLKWGYFCKCGNDNRLASQEEADFEKLVDGDPLSLERISSMLKIPDNKQFKEETI